MKKLLFFISFIGMILFISNYTYAEIDFSKPDPLYDELNLKLNATKYACEVLDSSIKWVSDMYSVITSSLKTTIKERLISEIRSAGIEGLGGAISLKWEAQAINITIDFADFALKHTNPADSYIYLADAMTKAGCSLTKIWFLFQYENWRETYNISSVLDNKSKYYQDMLIWILEKESIEENRYYCGLTNENEIQNRINKLYDIRCSNLLDQRKQDFQALENFDKNNQKYWEWLIKSLLGLNSSQIWNNNTDSEKINQDLFCGNKFDLEKLRESKKSVWCTKSKLDYLQLKGTTNDQKIIEYTFKNLIPIIDKMSVEKRNWFIEICAKKDINFIPTKIACNYAKTLSVQDWKKEQKLIYDSTTYPGCNKPNIIIGKQIWSACNVGSTVSGTGSESFGDYFAFWVGTNLKSVDRKNYSLIKKYKWVEKDQWVCASNYHIPNLTEWQELSKTYSCSSNDKNKFCAIAISQKLLLPSAGYNFADYWNSNGIFKKKDLGWFDTLYWTSSVQSETTARRFGLKVSSNNTDYSNISLSADSKVYWYPVRCIKN